MEAVTYCNCQNHFHSYLKPLIFFLLLLLTASMCVAGKAVQVDAVNSRGDMVVLDYTFGDYATQTIEIDGQLYSQLQMESEPVIKVKGAPELPIISRSIIISDDTAVTVRVVESQYQDIPEVDIVPSRGYICRSVDPATVPYEFGDTYQEDAFYPSQPVELGQPYILRDHRGVVVTTHPFQYNPATRVLRVYQKLTVEVVSEGPGQANILKHARVRNKCRAFQDLYSTHFLNFTAERYSALDESGNMLIIVNDTWNANVQPLATHKNSIGIPTTVVNISTIGNTITNITNYIQNLYDTTDLAFVLLVGDSAHITSPTGADSGLADPKYSLLAGSDTYPDIMVGRFSAQSSADVDTQVERTIEYETLPATTQSWFWKGTGVASNQGTGDDGEYDNEHIGYIRDDLLAFGYSQVDEIYDPTGTSTMVTNAVNAGRGIMNYCGHGGITNWSSTGFNVTNVNALTNDNELPFIFSVACVIGQFNYGSGDCFAESWLKATNGGEPTGAIGHYASTINQPWSPPMEAQDEFNILYTTDPQPYGHYGTYCYAGSCSMMDDYPGGIDTWGNGAGTFGTWHIFGDPSLQIVGSAVLPVVAYESHTIDDDTNGESVGNGDGIPECGETIELPVTLRSTFTTSVTNVTAQLSTSDPYITIIDADETYGTILASSTDVCDDDFDFNVDLNCPDGHVVTFTLDISADQGIWQNTFPVTVSCSAPVLETIYFEDFENGLSGYAIDNFQNGLWHLTDTCQATSNALYYGIDSSCNYDADNTAGTVTSPPLDLSQITAPIELHLNYYLETENYLSYDRAGIEVSVNGGPFTEIASNKTTGLNDPTSGWEAMMVDLSAYAGQSVRLRFAFDTVDGTANAYDGFYVDDIEIKAVRAKALERVFIADFNSGDDDFTIDNAFGLGSGLWHLTTSCGATSQAMYYGQDATCNFDNGLANQGTITSPVIDLTGYVAPATVSFNYYLETEYGTYYDVATVEISQDGGPFTVIASKGSGLGYNTGVWETTDLDLSLYAGSTIQVRFAFNTKDSYGNAYPGFYVDDVEIKAVKMVFNADFDSGTDGFAINNNHGNGNGLWHLTTSCLATTSQAMYYGQDLTCDYDNGVTNEGTMTSPVIDLTGYMAPAMLSFSYLLGTEKYAPSYDNATVEISQNGAPFVVVADNASSLNEVADWSTANINLSAYVGSKIQVRFSFDTVDSALNTNAGFYVDDVRITAVSKNAIVDINFEEGLEIFTIDNTFGDDGDGLWHLTTSCEATSTALYYGQDATCDFDTGSPNEGVVTSNMIDLTHIANPKLCFDYYLHTESSTYFDAATVEIAPEGSSSFVVVASKGSELTHNTGVWEKAKIDLSAYASSRIQIRFHFETKDSVGNTYPGFYIDNLRLTGEPNPCPPVNPPSNPIPPNSQMQTSINTWLFWDLLDTCKTIEDFEDGDISDYTGIGAGISASSLADHDGVYGLSIASNSAWIYRYDPDVYCAQGNSISCWVQCKGAGRIYFGFGANAAGCYSLVAAPNTGELIIQRNASYSYSDLAAKPQTWTLNKWYKLEVLWTLGGHIIGNLYDSDGTTLLNSIYATDSSYTSGGIAFRGLNNCYIDTIQRCGEAGTPRGILPSVFTTPLELDPATSIGWDEENQAPLYPPAPAVTPIDISEIQDEETDMLPLTPTDEEQIILDRRRANQAESKATAGSRNYPGGLVWTPGEYEPIEGILVRWGFYNTILTQMIIEVSDPSNMSKAYVIVEDEAMQTNAETALSGAGATMSNVEFLIYDTDTVWIRDYGPRYIYEDGIRVIVDHLYNRPRPLDDALPIWLSGEWDESLYELDNLVPEHGGGNFLALSNGDAFMSSLVLEENPAYSEDEIVAMMKSHHNVDLTIYDRLPVSIDSTGHIDMWLMPLSDTDILVSEFSSGDGYTITEAAVTDLQSRGYTIWRTPAWVSGAHYTYTNAVIANNKVLIPKYNHANDATALAAYQSAIPDHEIIQVDCSSIISSAGAIHCVMKHVYPVTVPTKYDVYMGTDPDYLPMIAEELTVPVYDPGTLSCFRKYYWQVTAMNYCTGKYSPVWSFTTHPTSDFNHNCSVRLDDYAYFAGHWMVVGDCTAPYWCEGADANKDGTLTLSDLLVFAGNWLD